MDPFLYEAKGSENMIHILVAYVVKGLKKPILICIQAFLVEFKDITSSWAIEIIYKIYVPSTWHVCLKDMSLGSINLSLFSVTLEYFVNDMHNAMGI